MYQKIVLTALILWSLPQFTLAAVSINEIAWMGSAASANDEWIELHNTGSSPVSVDDWVLTDSVNFSVTLSGTIAPDAYAVLERTDDISAPGTAFLIYTGALPNTGATLVLTDSSGVIIDQVAGGENWESVGGDNVTKDTAQYSVAGWITAPPTPGAQNSNTPSPPREESESKTDQKENKSSASGKKTVAVEKPKLFTPSTNMLQLDVSLPEIVYVNQPITFTALPANIGDTIMDSLEFQWNFGDFATATGKTAKHTYAYPGEYILTLRARFARHDEVFQTSVTVLPVRFSLTQNADGDIQIHNNSPYEVDVSGFTIVGKESVTFPPLSFIPVNGTVTIPKEKIGTPRLGQVQLHDRQATMLALVNEAASVPIAPPEPVQLLAAEPSAPVVAVQAPLIDPSQFSFASSEAIATTTATETIAVLPEPAAQTETKIEPPVIANLSAAPITAQTPLPPNTWPLFGLAGLIVLGLVGVYARDRHENIDVH